MRRACTLNLSVVALLTLHTITATAADAENWQPLFDGKTMKGWQEIDFAGHARSHIVDGTIQVDMGIALSGVVMTNKTPKVNYEVALEARKIAGGDFFCGLTVPVKESHCTLIVGGWGGSVIGISSIDGMDASENETSSSLYFETGKWFDIRLQVTADRLKVWVDRELLINVDIKDRRVQMRPGEIEIAKPFSLSTYSTTAQFRNIRLRTVTQTTDEE